MENLRQIHNRQKRALFFLLAMLALGWGFSPWPTVFAGLILGVLFGLYNFWILTRRMERFDRAMAEGKKAPSLGSGLRFASGIAAAAIAVSLPETFDLIATVIGLMIPYLFLLAERIISQLKHPDPGGKER
ncbi:ATP synthase I [Bhargavaea cecembensis]|uniref:ATP synthase I n=1 Tax=Bhargavaea cecembensis TaxID=394098 RepID=A0A161RJK8_9BACL|nr:ATP synthase subunit I [Bhargavaea cecembensis]KZE38428.1 ATP synthase I [Bhargavaea cecembensis]